MKSGFKDMVKKIILDKSAVVEIVTWKDENQEDNYAYLMINGKDYNKYQEAIKSGELTLEDWGMFYKDKGSKPSDDEIALMTEVFGKEAMRLKQEA